MRIVLGLLLGIVGTLAVARMTAPPDHVEELRQYIAAQALQEIQRKVAGRPDCR